MSQRKTQRDIPTVPTIQHISIRWTKSSRGGQLAERRNQIPRAFPLPSPPPIYDRRKHYTVHRIQFDEQNQFIEPLREMLEAPSIDIPFRTRNCSVEVNGEMPVIKYEWRNGAPKRTYIDAEGASVSVKKSYTVTKNHWVRVEYNGRFSCWDFGTWSYEHEIINVGLVDPGNRSIFVTTEPDTTYQQLAELW